MTLPQPDWLLYGVVVGIATLPNLSIVLASAGGFNA